MFKGFGPTLPAADMERAKAFYRDKLGMEPAEEGLDGSATYELGETRMILYPSEFAGTNKATAMGMMVDDIAEAVGTLRDRGLSFMELEYGDFKTVDGIMMMPDGSRGAWFEDSEGNIIGIAQEA